MKYFDVHAHLDFKDYDEDRDEVIKECARREVGVINNGVNPESNRKVLAISDRKVIFPALGIYPLEALKMSDEDIKKEIEFIAKAKPVAIGEVGMDFYYCKDKDEQKLQRRNLGWFLELAERLNVPIEIHSRGAELETIELLSSYNAKVIMHCYSGPRDNLPDYYFSIPVAILNNSRFRKLVKKVSIDRLLTETDSPYLNPDKTRNVPWNVVKTIEKIAELKKMDPEEVRVKILNNTVKLFKIQ